MADIFPHVPNYIGSLREDLWEVFAAVHASVGQNCLLFLLRLQAIKLGGLADLEKCEKFNAR